MNDSIPFLSPRFTGGRFEGHSVPLEVLRDLAALDEIIKETAKWRFLEANPRRKRVPRGFTEEISLRVAGIEPGSAVPVIVMCFLGGQLLSAHQSYFEAARESVIAAIDAAQHGGPITEHLPESILPHFDSLGRSLADDEAIEFRPSDPARPARLDKAVRRRLVLASAQTRELTDDVILRGTIPEADQEKGTFHLQTIQGMKIPGPIEPYHFDTILEAFNGFQQNLRVAIRGVAKFNRSNRLQSIVSIEEIGILDANDVSARIDELRSLKDGWLDGRGRAPSGENLDWFAKDFETRYPGDLQLPFVYPTAEGGLQLEWSLPLHEISLEVDLENRRGECYGAELPGRDDGDLVLDFNAPDAWRQIAEVVRAAGGTLA